MHAYSWISVPCTTVRVSCVRFVISYLFCNLQIASVAHVRLRAGVGESGDADELIEFISDEIVSGSLLQPE